MRVFCTFPHQPKHARTEWMREPNSRQAEAHVATCFVAAACLLDWYAMLWNRCRTLKLMTASFTFISQRSVTTVSSENHTKKNVYYASLFVAKILQPFAAHSQSIETMRIQTFDSVIVFSKLVKLYDKKDYVGTVYVCSVLFYGEKFTIWYLKNSFETNAMFCSHIQSFAPIHNHLQSLSIV